MQLFTTPADRRQVVWGAFFLARPSPGNSCLGDRGVHRVIQYIQGNEDMIPPQRYDRPWSITVVQRGVIRGRVLWSNIQTCRIYLSVLIIRLNSYDINEHWMVELIIQSNNHINQSINKPIKNINHMAHAYFILSHSHINIYSIWPGSLNSSSPARQWKTLKHERTRRRLLPANGVTTTDQFTLALNVNASYGYGDDPMPELLVSPEACQMLPSPETREAIEATRVKKRSVPTFKPPRWPRLLATAPHSLNGPLLKNQEWYLSSPSHLNLHYRPPSLWNRTRLFAAAQHRCLQSVYILFSSRTVTTSPLLAMLVAAAVSHPHARVLLCPAILPWLPPPPPPLLTQQSKRPDSPK